MRIAIWTTRAPKVDGIKEGVNACPYLKDKEIEYILQKVPSDISDMPLNIEETMAWARNRAQNIMKMWIEADYYIWIEWWANKLGDKAYLWGVVYVENNFWEGHYGFSPVMEIPKEIERRLYKDWEELGPIMWELSGKTDIRSENGSMGAWSEDMLTRQDEFASAFKCAISPFYNEYYKL